jgi:two-component system CheB/CheR fusion protein
LDYAFLNPNKSCGGALAKKHRKNAKRTATRTDSTFEPSTQLDSEAQQNLQKIFALIRAQTQIDISGYKLTTVGRRVHRQMRLNKIKSLADFATFLHSNPDAVRALSQDIFIHVTEFFRDPESFTAISSKFLPKLLKERIPGVPLRFWVPGCSTGEEPYSLAISMFEVLADFEDKPPFQIFATDISESAIEKARSGLYSEAETAGVSQARLKKFFEKTKDGYKIKKEVRDACIFSRHDLISNPPFAKMNLISCRNVLIYFDSNLQKQVLPIFHYSLLPEGYLWLGRSEAPIGISRLFSLKDKVHKIFVKNGVSTPAPFRFPLNRPTDKLEVHRKPANTLNSTADQMKEIDRIGLARYAPAGVVVNSELEIIQVRGHTAPFLELPSGHVSNNLLKMLRPELLPGVRLAIQAAEKSRAPSRKEGLTYLSEKRRKKIDVEVIPVNPRTPSGERQFIIFFEEPKPTKINIGRIKIENTKGKPYSSEAYVAELLQEIDAMRDYQQSLIEGFEATQEELTSSNEELQSTLEEFQSTNEELETSKEEAQATNEELTTVNDELQHRNEQLARSEERFRLLVEAVKGYAIFMLDPHGTVVSWNEGARRMKGYEKSEIVGANFSRFYLPEDVQNGHPQYELEIARNVGRYDEEGWRTRKDGSRFWANVVISRIDDSNHNIVGFAKVTRDLTDKKRVEEELRLLNEGLEAKVRERTADLRTAIGARDEFLSIASHELKTPLTALKLQLQVNDRLMRGVDLPESVRQKMQAASELMNRQVNAMTTLVEDLLDITRIQSGTFAISVETFNLSELVREVVDRFEEQSKKAECALELSFDQSVDGSWDKRSIEQVITNLLSNAVKHAPKSEIRICIGQSGKLARIVVEDSGPGIPEEKQSKIFERFERATSKNVSGMGLGLYIVKKIVEAHRGVVKLESKLGRGSKFIVELPMELQSGDSKDGT